MIIDGVKLIFPENMTIEEATEYMVDERRRWDKEGKELGRLEITLEGDEVILTSKEKSNISRIRRITGYLSESNNFNDSKKHELRERVSHEY